MGSAKGLFISFLQVNFSEGGIKTLTDAFKDVANAFFIVIFLIIIFSNTLSIGLDNYAIKKMLPRLVVGVIFVQFSYFIAAALIDLFNFFGVAIVPLVNFAIRASAGKNIVNGSDIAGSSARGINGYFSQVVAGGLAEIGIFIVLVLAIVALISVIITVAALFFRKFALVLLLLATPLAFVAWVLPNTEKYFKAWWTNFLKLLMMYPLITGILAVSLALAGSAGAIFQGQSELDKIILMSFPLVALILIPKTFKWGGQLMVATSGAVAARLNSGATNIYKKSAKEGVIGNLTGSALMAAGHLAPTRLGGNKLMNMGASRRAVVAKARKESMGNYEESDLVAIATKTRGWGHEGLAVVKELGKRETDEAIKQQKYVQATGTANPRIAANITKIDNYISRNNDNHNARWVEYEPNSGRFVAEREGGRRFRATRPTTYGGGLRPPRNPNSPIEGIRSDARLKHVFGIVGEFAEGINIYRFSYKWQPDEEYIGLMAQELLNSDDYQQFVILEDNGYYAIKYDELGFKFRRIR